MILNENELKKELYCMGFTNTDYISTLEISSILNIKHDYILKHVRKHISTYNIHEYYNKTKVKFNYYTFNLENFLILCYKIKRIKYIALKYKTCDICSSKIKAVRDNIYYCSKHYKQIQNNNVIYKSQTKLDKNEYMLYDNHAEFNIYNAQIAGKEQTVKCKAIIDLEDVEICKKYKWSLNSKGYIYSNKSKPKLLHNYILNIKGIDHINGNPLDNRRSNLRESNQENNMKNTLRKNRNNCYFDKNRNKYIQKITHNNKTFSRSFDNLSNALMWRIVKEDELFNEFRNLRIEIHGTNIVFNDYKKIGTLIVTPFCKRNCDKCQNEELKNTKPKQILIPELINTILSNKLSEAVIFGGMDFMYSLYDTLKFIYEIRKISNIDIVLYTGEDFENMKDIIETLKNYSNIIVKFGRYIPNRPSVYSDVLGINLASDNQYAIKIS